MCLDFAYKAKAWDEKMQNEYANAEADPENASGADIENAVDGSLKDQGIKTTQAGSTSPTGAVTVNPSKGPCAKLDDADTEAHEGVHAATQRALVAQFGAGSLYFGYAWNDARNWADDEINAYGAGAMVNEGFIEECRNTHGVVSSTEPPCVCDKKKK